MNAKHPKRTRRTFGNARQNGNKCPKYAALKAELKSKGLIIVNNRLLWTTDPNAKKGKPTLMFRKPTMKTLRWFASLAPMHIPVGFFCKPMWG